MKFNIKAGLAIVASAALILTAFVSVSLAGGGSSTVGTAGGGTLKVRTRKSGTECNMFSPAGNLLCTRTYPITNHKEAIAKCLQIKCH